MLISVFAIISNGLFTRFMESSLELGCTSLFFELTRHMDELYSRFASFKPSHISRVWETNVNRHKSFSFCDVHVISASLFFLSVWRRDPACSVGFSVYGPTPAFPVLSPCAFEGGSAWIPDVGAEQVAPGSAPPPSLLTLLCSPPSPSHISRVSSAPDWPPRMPLNGGA